MKYIDNKVKIKTPNQCDERIQYLLSLWSDNEEKNIEIFYHVLGLVFKKKRINMGWSQQEVADVLNVTFQQIQKYEWGMNKLPFHKIIMFCEMTKSSIDDYLKYFNGKVIKTNNATQHRRTHDENHATA